MNNLSGQIKRASVHTHGCRLNQAESQILAEKLQSAGYRIVPWGEPSDLGVINTCTVTREAEAKCRQSIRSFIRDNPGAFVAVVGCYSQTGASEVAAIPGVDLVIGNQEKLHLLDYLSFGKNPHPVIVHAKIDPSDFSIEYAGDHPFPQRANLKIQDGCDFLCSFCLIPFSRGRARSREWSNLLEEARALVRRGVKELVLVGVNIGTYDYSGKNIVDVVDALAEIEGLKRIRISSIEPTTAPLALLYRMADPAHPLVPYLHLPLQSGSDKILALMRRRYTIAEYRAFVDAAVRLVPDLCLGTDLLVGFPGETEEDFRITCDTFLEMPFAYAHVFTYSEREGTVAVRRGGWVPVPERNRRGAYLRRLSAKKRYDYHMTHLGREMEVLFENPRDTGWPGLTPNYIRVICRNGGLGAHDLANRVARVRLEKVTGELVEAELVEIQ